MYYLPALLVCIYLLWSWVDWEGERHRVVYADVSSVYIDSKLPQLSLIG